MRVLPSLVIAAVLAVFFPQSGLGAPTPLVEYLFNEGPGLVAVNTGTIGEAADGNIIGPVYSSDTPFGSGYSMAFDGECDTIQVPDAFDYTDKLTVEAWIKPGAVDGQRIIWDDYGNPGVVLDVSNGQAHFAVSTTADPGLGAYLYAGSIIVGEWQHVAGVYDGSEMRIYINGVQTGETRTTSGDIIDNPGPPDNAAVGSSNVEICLLNFDGNIDDFRIFNAALEPHELAGGYFSPPPPPPPALVDTMHPTGAVHAYDNVLWPPNRKMVSVSIEGYVFDELSAARDGTGIGVSSAHLTIDGNNIPLLDDTTNLLNASGGFNIIIEVRAIKGALYEINLYASDTLPEEDGGPNSGLVDRTYIRVR